MTEIETQLPLKFDGSDQETSKINYAQNGIIFANLVDSLNDYRSSKEAFCDFLRQAIINKIWLGLVHPSTGKFISFIHKTEAGEINDSVSFKLWIASSPKKGGLGFSSLEELEQMIKGDLPTSELAVPLMLDNHSVNQVNRLREAEGEPPLIRMSSSKQCYLKKCAEGPREFSRLRYERGLPLEFTSRCIDSYSKLIEESQEVAISELSGLIERCKDKAELEEKTAELFGITYRKMLTVDVGNPSQIARSIYKTVKEDVAMIKEIVAQLELIISEEVIEL
jgi:hypothetical protein